MFGDAVKLGMATEYPQQTARRRSTFGTARSRPVFQVCVQQHAQSFFALSEVAAGARLPQFVRDEFDAFLECSILVHGFQSLAVWV